MSVHITPATSLITPTRNHADLLVRTIKNVKSQTLKAWQMIVVDDGSGVAAAWQPR